ncbi:MAG TPA: hypothetical protein VNJ04_08130 [Gemmatimonadaceae bacterium]|nr:hypothetical protein [Gemmatimonadaceae bacterium]
MNVQDYEQQSEAERRADTVLLLQCYGVAAAIGISVIALVLVLAT